MEATADRGNAFREEGRKALTRMTIFGFGKSQKFEDAAEAFTKAGNAFKLANSWQSAGDVFLEAADAWAQAGDALNDSVTSVVEAANCYKKISPVDAVRTYRRAIDMYNDVGRFGMSARYAKEMAEVFEADHNNEGALAAFQEAADLFNSDNKKSNSMQCLQKVAGLAADMGELNRAADIFETLGKDALQSRLGQYSAKGHFFSCLLCHFALGDNVQVRVKVEAFKNADFTFGTSRECEFVEKLLQACDGNDTEAFSQHCADFDRITPLDPFKTTLLLKAKKFIIDVGGGEEGEPDLS